MVNANRACDLDESALSGVIYFFGMIIGQTSVCDLARNKDVFAITPTGLGCETKWNTEFKKLGLSAAAIGIGDEGEEDREKKAREGKSEIVFGSPESGLITKWQ